MDARQGARIVINFGLAMEAVMPVIKGRTTQKHFVRHITRLYHENNETLFAYATFIGERAEYVLNQLVETVLARDKDFLAWREQNPGSHVPPPGRRKRGRAHAFARPVAPAATTAAPAARQA
jgi:hypothetical protein